MDETPESGSRGRAGASIRIASLNFLKEPKMNRSPATSAVDPKLALWHEYRRTDDPALRNQLILTFAPLVKYVVYKKVRTLPARCEIEDFLSCGLEALIRSIDRFDPEKGTSLEQFFWTRI